MAELVDALASGASGRKVVEVRVFSWAPLCPIQDALVVQVPDFQAACRYLLLPVDRAET